MSTLVNNRELISKAEYFLITLSTLFLCECFEYVEKEGKGKGVGRGRSRSFVGFPMLHYFNNQL